MTQLDPADLTRILNTLLPTAQAAQQVIQNIASEINKTLTATANAAQRLSQSLNFSDTLVQNMVDNFDKIKNAVNGTKLGADVFDKKIRQDFNTRFNASAAIVENLNKEIIKLYDDIDNLQTNYPGDIVNIDKLKAMIPLAELALQLEIQRAEAIQNESDAYVDLIQKQKSFTQALESKSGFNAFESSLGIFGKIPTVARGLEQLSIRAKMTIGILYSVFQTVYDTFDQTQTAFIKTIKSFGLLKDEAEPLNTFIKNTTVNLAKYGVTAEDVAATITNMADAFGSLTLFSEKTGEDITLMSKQLGVGNKELTDSLMTLMSFGKIDMVKATKVVYFASALSKAAGVPLPKVMDDVAKAGDKARGMIKGGAEELIKAAVYARRLGTDLEKVAEIGRKMLDFQESITDEIEASVLLGSNISFQKARELFYTGKIQEGYDEIFNVVKNIGDFNKLDIFQKEAIAKSTGMSLTDLQKQLQIREDLAAIEISGSDEAKKMVQEYKKLTGQSGAVLENTAAAREQRVKDIINLKQTEEIMSRIKGLFLSISSWILPKIEGVLIAINWLLSKLDTTVGKIAIGLLTLGLAFISFKTFKTVFTELKLLMGIIRGALVSVTAATVVQTEAQLAQIAVTQAQSFAQLELAAAQRAAGLTGLAGLTGGLAAAEIYALGGAILAIAGAFALLAFGLKQFKDIKIEDVGLGLLALAGLIGLTSLAIAAMSKVIVPAAGVIGLFAGAIILLSYGIKIIGDGLLNAGQGISLFGDGLLKAISALVTYSKEVSTFTALNLAGVFVSLKSAINDFPLNDLQKIINQFFILDVLLGSIAKFKYLPVIDTNNVADTFTAISSFIRDFDLSKLQSIVSVMQSLASSLNSISAFKGFPQLTPSLNSISTIVKETTQLTLPKTTIDTTKVVSTMQPTPVMPEKTNTGNQTTNVPTANSISMIDAVNAVRQGLKDGMKDISLNVYLDGQKMVTGLSKNVAFRQDTGGIAMHSSLT